MAKKTHLYQHIISKIILINQTHNTHHQNIEKKINKLK